MNSPPQPSRNSLLRVTELRFDFGRIISLVSLVLGAFSLHAAALQRVPNTTLQMPLTAPDLGFTSELAFNDLQFVQPVAIAAPPGETNRLFIVEKWGRVCVITNLAAPTKTVFLDLWDRVPHDVTDSDYGLLSIAFHPGYATNGYFFVFYHLFATTDAGAGVHWRVARFQASAANPNFAPAESEAPLITQWHDTALHTGGDMHFGPDGYLYITVGDAEHNVSGNNYTQIIDRDFFSGILRLDVDKRRGSFPANPHPGVADNYRIPPDNPFLGATSFNNLPVDPMKVRTEFFAVGLRNPWRFSFDSKSGELYCTDVGGELREEVNLIVRGGNYGWNFYEGTLQVQALPEDADRIYTIPPLAQYGRDEGTCITGALLYRGRQFPQLAGAFVFSDFYVGKIGTVRYNGRKLSTRLENTLSEIQQQEALLDLPTDALKATQVNWERGWAYQQTHPTSWTILDPIAFSTVAGTNWKKLPDQSVLVTGTNPPTNTYVIEAITDLTGITAIRLEALPDESLPSQGPGRHASGAFVLSEFKLKALDLSDPSDTSGSRQSNSNVASSLVLASLPYAVPKPVGLTNATADFSQTGFAAGNAIDGLTATGWAIGPEWGKAHYAIFETVKTTGFKEGTKLIFTLEQNFGDQATIGRLRLSVTTAPLPVRADDTPEAIQEILRMPADSRTEQQQSLLASYYRRNVAPELKAARERLASLRQTKTDIESEFPGKVEWLANVRGISSMGIHPATDDILLADYLNGTIRRLVFNTNTVSPLPATLADTGAFADLATLTPQPGIVPYDVNVSFWSDNALKRRWFSVPDTNRFIDFKPEDNWSFPPGAIWIKHFELELTNGVPESARRLETRLLVRGSNDVYGVTYRWDESGTNALLVPSDGADESISINDHGIPRTQVWHYPSRSECRQCHTPIAGFALGFNTAQINRAHDFGGGQQNQLQAFSDAGYFSAPVTNLNNLPALADVSDNAASLEVRVRSYLAANCAQCHQPGGSARGYWDARFTTSSALDSVIDGVLVDNEGDARNRVLKPGSLVNSLLLHRLARLGPHHMPPLATTVVNQRAVDLIGQFTLDELRDPQSFYNWQIDNFGDPALPKAAADADPDGDGASNYLEYLAFSDPNSSTNGWSVGFQKVNSLTRITLPPIPARNLVVEWTTNLFAPASWQPLASQSERTFCPDGDPGVSIEDPNADGHQKYYRLRIIATPEP
ncbi:MAG: PQQ-dependent sugar dehydrogenase [Verrucomicrobia bacterium]|nr:PQQ-dependent sugar dehydrogenase [Verrucomicrobiota bacterium]